jgi:hypothetical protein
MNEDEFRAYSETDDHADGVSRLFRSKHADVVVIKRGIFGATVYVRGSAPVSVPIYSSTQTFKIGTGDVFSAVFAHYWASKEYPAAEAADIASRAVSVYCGDPTTPLDANKFARARPSVGQPPADVRIFGALNTLGRRYTVQEAAFCIEKLGVSAQVAEWPQTVGDGGVIPTLIISDGMTEKLISEILNKYPHCVVLDEEGRPATISGDGLTVCHDFTSAIYQVCQSAPKLK